MPLITPWLSSLWIGLVTPVDAGVARPLIEGLAVTDRRHRPLGMELFDIRPISFDEALRRAVADDPELVAATPTDAAGERSIEPVWDYPRPPAVVACRRRAASSSPV